MFQLFQPHLFFILCCIFYIVLRYVPATTFAYLYSFILSNESAVYKVAYFSTIYIYPEGLLRSVRRNEEINLFRPPEGRRSRLSFRRTANALGGKFISRLLRNALPLKREGGAFRRKEEINISSVLLHSTKDGIYGHCVPKGAKRPKEGRKRLIYLPRKRLIYLPRKRLISLPYYFCPTQYFISIPKGFGEASEGRKRLISLPYLCIGRRMG
jgi:hypothetical protein